jgi:hypothetical protein
MRLFLFGDEMKPKRAIDPNAAGDEVKRLLAEDGTASAALKDLRWAKAARKEALKKALIIVWQAFEKKQTVNGFATRKEWCTGFAKVTPRHCEHILYGREPEKPKANSRSRQGVVDLKEGMLVRWHGNDTYRVVSIGVGKDDEVTSLELFTEAYEEPLPKKKKKETASKKSTKVVHAIHVRPSDHEVTGTFCGLDEDKVQTVGFDADGNSVLDGVTCKRCLRKSHHVEYGFGKSQPTNGKRVANKDRRKGHLPYSPDYGKTYTTYCGKPLGDLRLMGTESENTKMPKCAKCVHAKYGEGSKRPFTYISDAEIAALREPKVTLVVKENCPTEQKQ